MVGTTAAGGLAGHVMSGHWDWRASLILAANDGVWSNYDRIKETGRMLDKDLLEFGQKFHGHKCPAMPMGLRAAVAAMEKLGVKHAPDGQPVALLNIGEVFDYDWQDAPHTFESVVCEACGEMTVTRNARFMGRQDRLHPVFRIRQVRRLTGDRRFGYQQRPATAESEM
jgi:hypothetical protein